MINSVRRARSGAVAGVILSCGLLLGACSEAGQSGAIPAGENPVAETAPPTSGPPLHPPSTSPKSSAQKLKDSGAKAKKDAGKVEAAVKFTMPQLVGRNLQAAQDRLQSLGSYLLHEEDASGDGRFTLVDRDWRVCSQVPATGAKVLKSHIVVLRAVKTAEKCP